MENLHNENGGNTTNTETQESAATEQNKTKKPWTPQFALETPQQASNNTALTFLLYIVFGLGSIGGFGMTLYNVSQVGWFNCNLSIWDLIGTALMATLGIWAIVAFKRKSANAVALANCFLTLSAINHITAIVYSTAMNLEFDISLILGSIFGIVWCIVWIFYVNTSNTVNQLIPRAGRKMFIVEMLMALAVLCIIVFESVTLITNINDPAKLFKSDRAFLEVYTNQTFHNETKSQHGYDFQKDSSDLSLRLEDEILVIAVDQHINVGYMETLIEPTEEQKEHEKRTFMRTWARDKGGKYLIEVLIRNNYSMAIEFNINNGDIAYTTHITTEELESYI